MMFSVSLRLNILKGDIGRENKNSTSGERKNVDIDVTMLLITRKKKNAVKVNEINLTIITSPINSSFTKKPKILLRMKYMPK